MGFYQNHKPAFYVLLSGLALTGILTLFSITRASEHLNQFGLKFTNATIIKSYFSNTENSAKVVRRIPQVVVPANIDSHSRKIVDTLKAKLQYLENYGDNEKSNLDPFFNALLSTRDKTVHIWYYGDSQIEGDRITGELRQLLQNKFGGSGTGYLPFSDLANYRYFELLPGKSLVKYNCFINKSPKGYSFAGKVFQFAKNDSSFSAITSVKVAPNLRYKKLYLLCGEHPGGEVILRYRDSFKIKKNIEPSETGSKLLLSENPLYGELRFQLPSEGKYGGLIFEGDNGIQIDNCGIRGHSGDGLRFITPAVIQSQAEFLNTRLVVFQFGNNMIPVIKGDEASMKYYTRYFEGIFGKYKKLLPNCSFLVISAGDMGTVIEGEEKAYPNVSRFVEAMRTAAFNSGCAFFDAHSMIAKDGGILGWVKKGYAGLDGHLTGAGQLKFATTLYAEMMREFEIYKVINQKL